jgi:hypothetical protein
MRMQSVKNICGKSVKTSTDYVCQSSCAFLVDKGAYKVRLRLLTINIVYATLYILYWKMLFLLRHVSVQWNHLQAIHNDFTKIIKCTYNGSLVFWSNELSLIYDI